MNGGISAKELNLAENERKKSTEFVDRINQTTLEALCTEIVRE